MDQLRPFWIPNLNVGKSFLSRSRVTDPLLYIRPATESNFKQDKGTL